MRFGFASRRLGGTRTTSPTLAPSLSAKISVPSVFLDTRLWRQRGLFWKIVFTAIGQMKTQIGYLINFGHKGTLEWKRLIISEFIPTEGTER